MKRLLYLALFIVIIEVNAQENLTYQKPPKEILELVDIQLAPSVLIDDKSDFMLLRYRDSFKTIAELSEEELRLAGLRINPKTNIGSRTTYYKNLEIVNLKSKSIKPIQVTGLPSNPRLANFTWSPDQKKVALTNTTSDGVSVWVLDIEASSIKKVTEAKVNANLRDVINWFEDSESMLVKMVTADKKEIIDSDTAIPTGPTISVSEGKKAQNRTYQDLLKSKIDEDNFEQLALSDIYKVSISGNKTKWLSAAMYNSIDFSPDGNYIMVSTVEKPFSYLVTYRRFASKTIIYSKDAKAVAVVSEVPLIEDLPQGFMSTRTGPRNFNWRADKAATMVYVEALDGGDPAKDVAYRDEVFSLVAPFNGKPTSLLKTLNRFSGIDWGTDNIAIAYDYWWNTRNTKTYVFNPSEGSQKAKIITDRSYQDQYSDPGEFVTERNEMGSYVLALDKSSAYLIGKGFSDKGQFPFVDKMDLETKKTARVYQSNYTKKLENIYNFNVGTNQLLVRIEGKSTYPNYFLRSLKNNKLKELTAFKNPFLSIESVHKEIITYKRDDGLELSGTLYLPVGYDMNTKEKMPMILWAYPREYKDKASAAQNTKNPNKFIYPSYGSPIYWVTRGYVVLADASFPIVGEGDNQPNDTFRKQLVANAAAAIDAVDELGYIDRNRVAVGGHSYGAFMVANLLSHSNLFAAGIARSGAYNRTLTPFGFQSEERSYWEAPDVYNTMSPFMHADKMKTPLLLIHGEADNNSGTYPLQSERYFNALKGLGATVRLVMLPKESHGYRGKESVFHLLWEQDQWLETHVKNKVPTNPTNTTLTPKK